jgi:YVTN family beta-propeller protein
VGVNPTTNRIYVANAANDTVSVIDGPTNTVAATVSIGGFGLFGVGVNPTTSRIYVAYLSSVIVAVIQDDIDTRPPEAFNQFSPASRDVQLFCRDLGDGASGCADGTNPVAFTAVPTTGGQLRTYTVKDNAGNTLVLNEQVRAEVSALQQEVTASTTSLQYCTGGCSSTNPGKTITPPANQKKFEAEANASGAVSSLEQKLTLGSKEVEAEWTAAAGQTTITVLVNDQRTSRVTKPGQVLLRLATDATQTPVLHIEDSTGATF